MAKTRDGGALGRARALRIRREKVEARRALVAKLAERRRTRELPELSISQAVRLVERATGTRWSSGTIANDLQKLDLAQPAGPRRRHEEPGPRECLGCSETFTPKDASQVARGHGLYCLSNCYRSSPARSDVGRRSAEELHRRADERQVALNAAGYLTMRQAADEIRVAEATLHRFAACGFLTVGGRRKVESEWWRLVTRQEFDRFKAEDWPALRNRHARMRLEDAERGWPRMPKTWGPEARRRNARRRDSLRKRGRRYSESQRRDALRLLSSGESIRRTAEQTALTKNQVEYLKREAV